MDDGMDEKIDVPVNQGGVRDYRTEEEKRGEEEYRRRKLKAASEKKKWLNARRRAFKLEQKKVVEGITTEVEAVKVPPAKRDGHVKSKHVHHRGFLTATILTQFTEMLERGAKSKDLATAFGVCNTTIANWRRKVESGNLSDDQVREVADQLVENSLLKRAVGYEAPKEIVQFSKEGSELRAQSYQHVPPETDAIKFWLKNRQPTRWRDHIDTDITLIPRLVVQTHLGEEVLHDAKTIEQNTPKLLQERNEPTEEQDDEIDKDQDSDTLEKPWTAIPNESSEKSE